MNLTEKEQEIYNEYLDSLQNLSFNSKPMIDMLTDVAEENKDYARVIVQCIEDQLERVPIDLKLLILFLIDSIIKCETIRQSYMHLFCMKLHWTFAKVYKEGKEDVRNRLTKLRFTWSGIIPLEFLNALDNEIRKINPSWQAAPQVHINPKFVPRAACTTTSVPVCADNAGKLAVSTNTTATKEELLQKRKELNALKRRGQELEKELKLLRLKRDPIKSTLSDDKTEKLSAMATNIFSQAEKLKTCSIYEPAEVQRVREAASSVKNAISKCMENISKEQVPTDPKLAALAKDTTILKDFVKKLTETEKILAETEKNNQGKQRRVILDRNHLTPKSTVTSAVVTSSSPSPIRQAFSPRSWPPKTATNNPYVYTKPATNAGVNAPAPQNPPAFRIAPVSTQLINAAAARRARDPRLRKIEQESKPINSNASVTKEVKTQAAPIPPPIDTKNDKQNVLLTDVSKGKESVSENETKSLKRMSPSSSVDSDIQEKSAGISQVDRVNESKVEKNGPSKSSKTDVIEKPTNVVVPTSEKISSTCDVPLDVDVKKKESPVKFHPRKHDLKAPKSGSKPTKIKIKVEKIGKNFSPKVNEKRESRNKSPEAGRRPTPILKKEERNKKLNAMAEALSKSENANYFIEGLSHNHPKLAQRLTKLVEDKRANKKPPVVDGELMDITDDKSDLEIVSSPKRYTTEKAVTTVRAVEELDQPVVIPDDLTTEKDDIREESMNKQELADKEEELRKEVERLEEEQKLLEANIQQKTAEILENAIPKTPPPPTIHLSERLEAVMNASASESVSNHQLSNLNVSSTSGDVDIRKMNHLTLLTNTIASKIKPSPSLSVPLVTEIISTPLATVTDSAGTFRNPFGICDTLTSKDVDYRKLFSFPLAPPVPPTLELTNEASIDLKQEPKVESVDMDVNKEKESKNGVKRKHDDGPVEKDKRRRTTSSSSCSSTDSERFRYSPVNKSDKQNSDSKFSDSENDNEMNDMPYSPGVVNDKSDKEVSSAYSQSAVLTDEEKSCDLVIMSTSEPRALSNSPPMFPFFGPNFGSNFTNSNFGLFPTTTPEIPEANEDVLNMIARDPTVTTRIDQDMREIRHYGSTAVIFMNWDDPRQISFFNGVRKIVIDDKYVVVCDLNKPDVESLVYGRPHRFRLGAPTRELYIDGIGYQCDFGGPPIKIRFDQTFHYVRLDGKPPRVNIGNVKRIDLVAGKVDIIINEEHTFPLFLDAKPQSIVVNGIPFVLMFIDALKRVLINDVPFSTEFGKLAQSFKFKNHVYYFRFTALPAGIIPGAINISQMVMTKLPSPPPLPPSLQFPAFSPIRDEFPLLPPVPTSVSTGHNINNLPNVPMNPPFKTESGELPDSSVETVPAAPPINMFDNVNIDELFQKLVASGIVPSSNGNGPSSKIKDFDKESKRDMDDDTIRYVDFRKPGSLKQKQPGLIKKLYSGIQCGSCGLRFPTEQTLKYSQHLDWHFRLNRRGKDGARTIHSRKWYYNSSDWLKFQEMEDNSDRAQNWFESHATTEYTEEIVEEVPCVSAGDNAQEAACELCRDKFEQFYNEDIEEWQLRNAIRIDDKVYHPICHQDHKDNDEPDIEEIIDEPEPVQEILDDSLTPTKDNNIIVLEDSVVIVKQEKPDVSTVSKSIEHKINTDDNSSINLENLDDVKDKKIEEDDDSDIEEVQLIEEPIEEIIINDDVNDLEQPNLETLNVEDIVAAQQEIEQISMEVDDKEEEPMVLDNIVDITHGPHVASIDGNVELNDSLQVISGATKIKINIAKSHTEEKVPSPVPVPVPAPTEENRNPESPGKPENVEGNESTKEPIDIIAQPLPPGEELIPADQKERLKERKLTEYPPVSKGNEMSGLCSIM